MRFFKKSLIFFCFLFLITVCTYELDVNNKIAYAKALQTNSKKAKSIPFQYFFRGFVTLKENQAEAYPHGTYIIESNGAWHDLMNKYVPGIPYYVSVDYSKECLVFSVLYAAKPIYINGADIETFKLNENKLEPVYVNNKTLGVSNGIYSLNIDGIEHCYVNIVKISRKYISKNARNIYHKGNTLKTK